jgi:hypothetical protein
MLQARGALLTGLGIGIGAGLMYFLDPERGGRRRAVVRDQMADAANRSSDALRAVRRDMASRTSGTVARVRAVFDRQPVDDQILVERARAQLGHLVSHPRAIGVTSVDGVVTVRGPILQAEVMLLLKALERVRGVRGVLNQLEEHKDAAHVPALQGGSAPRAPHRLFAWSPAARAVAGATGTALAGYGASRRGLSGTLLAAAGLGLVTRAATRREMRRSKEVSA